MSDKSNIEIEKKYIIELPCVDELKQYDKYTVSEIVQTYLPSSGGATHRVRLRKYADRIVYTETVKVRIDNMSAYEDEREMSASEYESIIERYKDSSHTLTKIRHTFEYFGQIFEIDVYPSWQRTCIMETELETKEAAPKMPPIIKIVTEVTGDKRYSNALMSRSFPCELL